MMCLFAIAGPIGAGRTTTAEIITALLGEDKVCYARTSDLPRRRAREQGLPEDADILQKLTHELEQANKTGSAHFLIDYVCDTFRECDRPYYIADGMRKIHDFSKLISFVEKLRYERKDISFVSLYLDADAETRHARYNMRQVANGRPEISLVDFAHIGMDRSEEELPLLRDRAMEVVDTSRLSRETLRESIIFIMRKYTRE
jgi:hypothetical protein